MDSSKIMLTRLKFAVLGVVFLTLVIIASLNANFLISFGEVVADPWGLVAIADLYFGFILFAGIILAVDGMKPASFIWIVALFCAGNVLSGLWFVLRLPRLIAASRR